MIQAAKRLSTITEYYFSSKLKEIKELQKSGNDILNLGIGNPDMPPPLETVKMLHYSSSDNSNHGYQSYTGSPNLREAFVNWYKRHFNVDLNANTEALPLIGSKEGIMHISMAFLNPGDSVLIPDPGYPAYKSVTDMLGANVIKYDLKEENAWFPDLNKLQQLNLTNVKMMWINYPNMPTGTKASLNQLKKLVDFAIENEILICNDNPYSFILNDNPLSILNIPRAKDIALELNSLSKSHNMAGWRIGVVVGNEQYISNILKVKSNVDSGMYLPLQLAAVEALNTPKVWYDNLNKEYLKRRKIAEKILENLDCSFDKKQTGMFLWAKIPQEYKNSYDFSDYILKEYELFLTPGGIFGKNGEQYIRISLAGGVEKLHEALKRVGELVIGY